MKTWFITGTSSGSGGLLTGKLLGRGDRVAATFRRPGALDDLRSADPERLWTAELNVTDAPAVDAAFTGLGPVNMIVSNAGSGRSRCPSSRDRRRGHPPAVPTDPRGSP